MQADSYEANGRRAAHIIFAALICTLMLAVWARPATATTFSAATQKDTSMTPNAVAVGDVNSDGRSDVVVANFNGNSISVFLQDAGGALTDAISYRLLPTSETPVTWPGMTWTKACPSGLAVGDLSGDGADDVIVADQWNYALFYFEQDNPGSMVDPLDNTPDLRQLGETYVPLRLSQPPGTDPDELFTGRELQHANALGYRFHFEDLTLNQAGDRIRFEDGRGRTLLTYSTPMSASDFYTPVLYTDPRSRDGVMKVNFEISESATMTTSTWNIDSYEVWLDYRETHPFSMPYGLAIGDLVHQAPGLEFVVAQPFAKNFDVFGVSGGQIFKWTAPEDDRENIINARSYGVAVGDLNFDLVDDFAMAGWDTGDALAVRQSSHNWYVRSAEHDIDIGTNPFGVAVGDLNNDRRDDVAGTAYGDNTLSFALQNTAAYFEEPVTLETGNRPMGLAIADVTADGKNDIVVANSASNSVGVFTQTSDGAFSTQSSVASGKYPYGVATGDVDGDGGLEIISADSNDDQITVYQPQPQISWSTPSSGAYVRGTVWPTVTAPAGTGIAQVAFERDGLPILPAVSSPPYKVELDTTAISDGTHTLKATANDGYGHTYATSRSFKVDNTPPVVSYVSDAPDPFYPIKRNGYRDNTYFKFRLNEGGSFRVYLYYGGSLIRTLSKSGRGGWNYIGWDGRWSNGRRRVGTYYYRIRAYDHAGNTILTGKRPVRVKYYVLVRVAPNKVVLVPR